MNIRSIQKYNSKLCTQKEEIQKNSVACAHIIGTLNQKKRELIAQKKWKLGDNGTL